MTLRERFTVHSQMSPDITAPRHATVTAARGQEERVFMKVKSLLK